MLELVVKLANRNYCFHAMMAGTLNLEHDDMAEAGYFALAQDVCSSTQALVVLPFLD